MNKTKIEWTDASWNPVTGCLHGCRYCYARKIATRFAGKAAFPDGFKPTLHPERLSQPIKERKPKKIFVCSMADLFGEWVPVNWIDEVIDVVRRCPQHTFQFLTKNPARLDAVDWPVNCWVGVTAETQDLAESRVDALLRCNARVKFLSAEPIQERIESELLSRLDWLIVGWVSGAKESKRPDYEKIESILYAARKYDKPVFEKPNTLRPGPKEFPNFEKPLSLF
jgi:protein gp37